jgi:ubiquinone biosynthesis accessory factor UbiK
MLHDTEQRTDKVNDAFPAEGVGTNATAILRSDLARLNLLTRDEFESQTQILLHAWGELEAIQARVAELESAAHQAGSDN